jgi:hypothetical protein
LVAVVVAVVAVAVVNYCLSYRKQKPKRDMLLMQKFL